MTRATVVLAVAGSWSLLSDTHPTYSYRCVSMEVREKARWRMPRSLWRMHSLMQHTLRILHQPQSVNAEASVANSTMRMVIEQLIGTPTTDASEVVVVGDDHYHHLVMSSRCFLRWFPNDLSNYSRWRQANSGELYCHWCCYCTWRCFGTLEAAVRQHRRGLMTPKTLVECPYPWPKHRPDPPTSTLSRLRTDCQH